MSLIPAVCERGQHNRLPRAKVFVILVYRQIDADALMR
jgi:hypothetical protein